MTHHAFFCPLTFVLPCKEKIPQNIFPDTFVDGDLHRFLHSQALSLVRSDLLHKDGVAPERLRALPKLLVVGRVDIADSADDLQFGSVGASAEGP